MEIIIQVKNTMLVKQIISDRLNKRNT